MRMNRLLLEHLQACRLQYGLERCLHQDPLLKKPIVSIESTIVFRG